MFRQRRQRRGVATVEMALVAPFVFFLIFSSVEFSRMMMIKQALTNAAREGCRQATLATLQHHDSADFVARSYLRGIVAEYENADVVRVSITPAFTSSPASGTEIVTTVEVDCADVSWFPGAMFAGARIRGVSSMNRE
jgi:Flp pilus assembly protein TadG